MFGGSSDAEKASSQQRGKQPLLSDEEKKAKRMEKRYLDLVDPSTVPQQLEKFFGTKEDETEEEGKFQTFMADFEEINLYVFFALVFAHPHFKFTNFRTYLKFLMLPVMQFVVPILIVQKQLRDNFDKAEHDPVLGYCPDNDSFTFRVVGCCFLIYSLWAFQDTLVDGASVALMRTSSMHYKITGVRPRFFYALGFCAQIICGFLLLGTLYLMMAQAEHLVDLVTSCFGVNFLLNIDDEWVKPPMVAKAKKCAEWQYRAWRSTPEKTYRESIKGDTCIRRVIVPFYDQLIRWAVWSVMLVGYLMTAFFTLCPAEW